MLFFVIWIGVALLVAFGEGDVFMGILVGLIIASISFFIICSIPWGEVETVDTSYEMCALVDNYQFEGGLYGNIFVIAGSVDEELQYQFMYKVDGKGWTTKEMDADQVYLNFNCDKPAYIEQIQRFVNPTLEAWIPYNGTITYILNLPDEAMIIDSYTIDFQ